MPSTLKTELDRLGFDWKHGEMVLQEGRGAQTVRSARQVTPSDAILSERWSNGGGTAYLPRFIAKDKRGLYVPFLDDKGSGLRFIASQLDRYLESTLIPYPGD